MTELTHEAFLAAANRVELEFAGCRVTCRLHAVRGEMIQLASPVGPSLPSGTGVPVRLQVMHAGRCYETEARTRQWIWSRPPLLVLERVTEWREGNRRRSERLPQVLYCDLLFADGRRGLGRTRDVSACGLSLLLDAMPAVDEGECCEVRLYDADRIWCEGLPVRLVRLQKWLRGGRRLTEAAADLLPLSAEQGREWCACVTDLAPELGEPAGLPE